MRSGNMMYETYTRFCLYGGLSRSKLGVNNINSTVNDLKASNVTTLKLLDWANEKSDYIPVKVSIPKIKWSDSS